MKGFLILAVAMMVHVHSTYASLALKGPEKPILEGDDVMLECLITDSEVNMSQVHFERFAKYMRKWYRVEPEVGYLYRHCFQGYADVRRESGRLFLYISSVQSSYSEGPYRCVTDNTTAPNNSSEPLTLNVHYMRSPTLYREGVARYLSYQSLQDLRVRLGEDVKLECSTSSSEAPEYYWQKDGGDWILPSSKLTLEKVSVEDGGDYTCMAEHPTISSLKKSRTISITVLPEDAPWYDSTNGRLVLMTSAAGAALLVVILSMTVFLCHRTKQAKSSKGPIDDHSQKKPIYKASVESIPSSAGDKQPLV